MNQKRTVVVAGTVSALLLGASAAFAVGSGLFAAGAADKVGSFQAIEQAAASRRPASIAPSSTTRADRPTSTPAPVAHESGETGASSPDVTPSGATTPETESNGFRPPSTTAGSEDHGTTTTEASAPPTINRPTTSTSGPEHEVEPPDNGSGSDD